MPPDDARLVADTLVQADLWGHQSHGVLRLPWYLARLKAGVCTAVAAPTFVVDAGAVAVIDGGDAMGQVLTAHAMRDAIRRAKAHGIAAVALRNSNHFGTALYFTLTAARAGCVAFLSTNASPAMAPWGGRQKTVGTNPWSWAAPAGKYAPMVLDIANTGVARGKMMIVLDIEAFQRLPDFEARMERLIEELKAVPLAVGHEEIFYPGEIEARNEARNRRDGLVLPPDTIRDLEKVAAECGLPSATAP